MSSYWDYLKGEWKNPLTIGPASFIHAAFDKLYDESHGAQKYYLSKTPILGWVRRLKDAAKQAQDTYNNTGKDPAYSTRLNGPGFESLYGDVGAGVGAVRMARSLSAMYSPEVIENVGFNANRPEVM